MQAGDLDHPWFVAAWPGMGVVALGAATFLQRQLSAEPVADIPAGAYFDVTQIAVKDAVLQPWTPPKNTLYAWKNPTRGGRDLLIFIGEAQPSQRGYAFCRELMEQALAWDVSRVFTFAAMATPSHPKSAARVFAVASAEPLLEELREQEVEFLNEGEISGLNGVLLGAAAERDLEGICLLGEFPYFASGIANPKASAAVLRVFSRMAHLDLDLSALEAQAASLEVRLTELLGRLQQAAEGKAQPDDIVPESFAVLEETEPDEEPGPRLTAADRRRVERLFAEAAADRHKALALKAELDRLGVFKEYEDRFLDLFKRGE